MADGITKNEMRDLLIEQAKVIRGGSSGNSGGGSGGTASNTGGGGAGASVLGAAAGKAAEAFNPLTAALGVGAGAVGALKTAYDTVSGTIKDSLGTWENLSNSGASFSNDIVGMRAAASGTRMELGDFADVIKKNSGNFNGLGGNAAKGAEQFAKLSKEMADSGVNEDLIRLGMTSKDINEVLALQVGMQQSINMDDAAQRKKAIESAVKLATEMDSMAKLTGVSRKEQEENMKKAQSDMQVEAKMRIIGAKEGPEAEAKARAAYAEQYNAAQLRGQGQMFKEVFATGTVQSQEAANQVAISGREAQMTMAQAKATAAGDAAAASEYSKQAQVEALKNGQDVNKLNLAVYSSNTDAGKAMKDSMTANLGMHKSELAVRAKMEKDGLLAGMTEEQKTKAVHAEALKQIEQEQTNKNADGTKKAGSESTEALLKVSRAAGDVESAFMDKIVVPLNEKIGPAINSVADVVIPGMVTRNKTAAEGGGTEKIGSGAAVKKDVQAGKDAADSKKALPKDAIEAIKNSENTSGYGMGGAARAAGQIAESGSGVLVNAVNGVRDSIVGVTKRAEGTTTTGPELAVIGEAGKEHVIPDDKMQTLMQNVKLDGLSKATEAMTKDKSGGGGIDIGAMSKMVSTTVSSATSPGAGSSTSPGAGSSTSAVSGAGADAVDDRGVNKWKKWITDGNDFKADAERESAVKNLESIRARLADRQSQVAALEQSASQRELSEKEQQELRIAKFGVQRATNNLKDNEARMVAIDQLEKEGASKLVNSKKSEVADITKQMEEGKAKALDSKKSEVADITKQMEEGKAKALDSKKSEVAEVGKQEESKKASVVAQSVFSAMATIGLTDNQKKMYGEFANLSAEDSANKQASLKEEEASARAANTAASKARDAIEEKAELEGRKMTEAEEAEHKALGIIQNSSADKITAAQEEQQVLSRADEQRVFQAKVQTTQAEMQTEVSNRLAEITKTNGLASQESLQKEAEFRLIGVTQGAEAEAKAREESVNSTKTTSAEEMAIKFKEAEFKMIGITQGAEAEAKAREESKKQQAALAAADSQPALSITKPKEQSETEKLKAEYAKMSTAMDADPKKLQELKGKIDSSEAKEKEQSKPKGIADVFGAMFAEIKLPDVQKITSTATKINPPEDVAKKAEEDKKAKAAVDAKAAEAKKPAEAAKSTGEVTLKEVHASLEHLNKSMAQMLTYTQQTASAAQQQVKATKNLSGNKFG